ncbi:MAG: superoxide dismutase [Eubacterium sp.]|nr:superoxide dismutase [Eubacterium sp.]
MFEQVKLDYGNDGLEPVIDTATVETHYGKHHALYTKNLNDAAEKAGVADKDIEKLLASLDDVKDEALRKAIRNNGGGYYNHNLYFSTLSSAGNNVPEGELKDKIDAKFGSFDKLKEELTTLALGQFGSGWAWLSVNPAGELMTSNSPNQDNPISEGTGFIPIVAIDVWEHAYYLKYKNLRADYVAKLFDILDWKKIGENYKRITGA